MVFLLYILAAYVVLLVLLRLFERRMIFFPDYPGRLEGDWHPRKLDPEDVWITAADGTRLHAWWVPNANAKFTFLAFHGNASNIANRAPTYEFLRDTPANVLALEYRGYGHSEGKPTEAGLYLDAEAAYQYLVNTRRLDPKSDVGVNDKYRRLRLLKELADLSLRGKRFLLGYRKFSRNSRITHRRLEPSNLWFKVLMRRTPLEGCARDCVGVSYL